MHFYRTHHLEFVRRILAHPEIYPHVGDDYSPAVEEFQPNPHPDIWYVAARNDQFRTVGLFVLVPQNRVCWELHAAMLPCASTADKWGAARWLAPWLAINTECRRLVAGVPADNRRAIIFGTHGLGMRYCGKQEKAIMRNGQLEDLVLLGRSICLA